MIGGLAAVPTHSMANIKLTAGQSFTDEVDEEGENIWGSILGEARVTSSKKLPAGKSVVILGENESGKTTLIANMQGCEDPKKGAGLEYHCIDVQDEYRDDQTQLGVYILDGEPTHTHLLKFTLKESNFEDVVVVLTASMTEPWSLCDTLQRWSQIIEDHIDQLRVSGEKMREYREKLVARFQSYVEPGEESGKRIVLTPNSDEERVLLPLDGSTLICNLGIQIVVVVTKSDFIWTLEKEQDYKEEHFDYIQQHIRKFCLKYGAALFYCSVKEGKNCDLLYRYLVHCIYDLPFNMPAQVVEKDSVFIPTGWDSEKKISILYENMHTLKPESVYSEVIVRPVVRKAAAQREGEVLAEDDQVFLLKLQTQLNQQGVPQAAAANVRIQDGTSPVRSPGLQKSLDRRVTGSPGVQGSPKKIDASPKAGVAAGANEGVLANFFNSLLQTKMNSPNSPSSSSSSNSPSAAVGVTGGGIQQNTPSPSAAGLKSAMRNEAAAELDKLQSRVRKSVQGTSSPQS